MHSLPNCVRGGGAIGFTWKASGSWSRGIQVAEHGGQIVVRLIVRAENGAERTTDTLRHRGDQLLVAAGGEKLDDEERHVAYQRLRAAAAGDGRKRARQRRRRSTGGARHVHAMAVTHHRVLVVRASAFSAHCDVAALGPRSSFSIYHCMVPMLLLPIPDTLPNSSEGAPRPRFAQFDKKARCGRRFAATRALLCDVQSNFEREAQAPGAPRRVPSRRWGAPLVDGAPRRQYVAVRGSQLREDPHPAVRHVLQVPQPCQL